MSLKDFLILLLFFVLLLLLQVRGVGFHFFVTGGDSSHLFSLFFLKYFDINIHYLCHFFHVKYINNLFKVLSKFKRTLNFIFSL